MMEPLQQYLAKLAERHAAVRNAWNVFLTEVGKGHAAGIKATAALGSSLAELQALFTAETTPHWLKAMYLETRRLAQNNTYLDDRHRVDSFRKLWNAAEQMEAQRFGSMPSPEIGPLVSVDEIVNQHFSAERRKELDELYDSAIRCIHNVVETGKVDSKKVTQDLQRILATIEDARRSSFISQRVQISTLDRYLSAVVETTAERIPGLKFLHDVIKKAGSKLEATNNEIINTLNRRIDELSDEMRRIASNQPVLTHSSYEVAQIPILSGAEDGREPS